MPDARGALGLPRATVQRIDTMDSRVDDLSDCLDEVSNHVDSVATELVGTRAAVKHLALHLANDHMQRQPFHSRSGVYQHSRYTVDTAAHVI